MPSAIDFSSGDGTDQTGPGEVAGLYGVNSAVGQAPIYSDTSTTFERGGPRLGTVTAQAGTVADGLSGFYQLSPAELANVQSQLYAGGFYSGSYYADRNPKQVHLGFADDDTYDAFKSALVTSARSGRSLDAVLADAMASNRGLPGQGAAATGPKLIGGQTDTHVLPYTNPADLNAVLSKTFQDVLGRKAKKGEVDKFVAAYHANERDYYQPQFTAADKAATEYRAAQRQEAGVSAPTGTTRVPDGDQNAIAAEIVRVGRAMGANDKVILSAIEAGIVESGLRNLNYGDKDSLGVFQQRPSQGWGTQEQVRDVTYAATQYFQRAINADGAKPQFTPGQLAQYVQRSAYPERYDKVEGTARAMLSQVGGVAGPQPADTTGATGGAPQVIETPVSQTVEVTQPATPANAAEAQARADQPQEAAAHDLFGQYRTLLAMFGAGGGG